MLRTYRVKIRRTVEFEREVFVQVDETPDRLKDEKLWPDTFEVLAHDVYFDKSKLATLAGWEQVAVEYETISIIQVEDGHMIDVVV